MTECEEVWVGSSIGSVTTNMAVSHMVATAPLLTQGRTTEEGRTVEFCAQGSTNRVTHNESLNKQRQLPVATLT